MFIKNNIVYSEAGKVLVSNNKVGYELPASEININEEDIVLDDMKLSKNILRYSNGRIVQRYYKDYSYADWKSEIIKWRYSNDEQIAIILNKDMSEDDANLFQKMQDWREWASRLAKKILSL